MELITQCALRVAHLVWRPGHGGFAFTVVCKATFDLRPQVSPLAAEQEPVTTADVPGAGGALALASDLVPMKKRPEVLVVGHAHAPGGVAVPSLTARVAVGEIDKAIQVTGDRFFALGGELGAPARFTRMPLSWDRAAGGPDTGNPAGRPLDRSAPVDFFGRVPAPNLLPVGLSLASRDDIVAPVGMGPIAPYWPSRAMCLHRHAAGWDPTRWHERPLPADIDLAYFNAAPSDQQRATPFGDEQIYLENLHPRFAHLSTRLAAVSPVATVDPGGGPQPLQLRCDTLIIDAERGLAMLVWRAHVLLDRPDRPGRILVTEPTAQPALRAAWTVAAPDSDATEPPAFPSNRPSVLPFQGAAAPGDTPSSEAPIRVVTRPLFDPDEDVTQPPGVVTSASILPFGGQQPERLAPSPAPFAPAPAAPPGEVAFRWSGSPGGGELPSSSVPAEPPPRPAMLGAALTTPADTPPAPSPAPAPPAEPEAALVVDDYPPSRCGAIAARLACDPKRTESILHEEGLDAPRWEQVHAQWLDRIDAETERGRNGLLSVHDGAYVAEIEAIRGPVTPAEYARLLHAAERDEEAEELAAQGLPEEAWPHVRRVWIQRMVGDLALTRQVRAALAELRAAE